MLINWPAFQTWLSQPWVLTLGVLVIAAGVALTTVEQFIRIGGDLVGAARTNYRSAKRRRDWARKGYQVTTVKQDGRVTKRVVPVGGESHG